MRVDARYKLAVPRSDAAGSAVYEYVGGHATSQLDGHIFKVIKEYIRPKKTESVREGILID